MEQWLMTQAAARAPRAKQPTAEPNPESQPESEEAAGTETPQQKRRTPSSAQLTPWLTRCCEAYQERDFTAAQQVLNALLAESPNDLRCLLLQGYVRSFGFHDEPAAISSYQRVLELEAEGPYRDLAIEGLSQCGVNLDPAPAEPEASEPEYPLTHSEPPISAYILAEA